MQTQKVIRSYYEKDEVADFFKENPNASSCHGLVWVGRHPSWSVLSEEEDNTIYSSSRSFKESFTREDLKCKWKTYSPMLDLI